MAGKKKTKSSSAHKKPSPTMSLRELSLSVDSIASASADVVALRGAARALSDSLLTSAAERLTALPTGGVENVGLHIEPLVVISVPEESVTPVFSVQTRSRTNRRSKSADYGRGQSVVESVCQQLRVV
jgi:hypothetical protein